MPRPRLVLWDIDGTLVESHRAGREAMTAAGVAVFGEGFSFDGVAFAGQLDLAILRAAASARGVSIDGEAEQHFYEAYFEALAERLARDPRPTPLPGVEALLEGRSNGSGDAARWGLLTGNHRVAAGLKLAAAGIDERRFSIGAFGNEADRREQLVALALERYRAATGEAIDASAAVVVGDTPSDVEAARAHGCMAVGVATGGCRAAALADAGADHVLDDLTSWLGLWASW